MSTDYLAGASGGPSTGQLSSDLYDYPAFSPAAAAPDPEDPSGGAIATDASSPGPERPPRRDKVFAIDEYVRDVHAPPEKHVEVDIVDASKDEDVATRQTIAGMCEYINAAARDPFIQRLAIGAIGLFAKGRHDPYSAAWAVFWFLKHRVKRIVDESLMQRFGAPGDSRDWLTDPRILLRQSDPKEDCDGFTMSAIAMLCSIGVEACIATVACDRNDPERWSHVFALVRMPNGDWMPLDCSHGPRPGWMVPAHDIYRWQCYALDASPIDAKPSATTMSHQPRAGLRGYIYRGPVRRRRGVGDPCNADDADYNLVTCLGSDMSSALDPTTLPGQVSGGAPTSTSCPSFEQLMGITDPSDPCQTGLSQPSTVGSSSSSAASSTTSSTSWLTALFGSTLPAAAKVIQTDTLPVGTVIRNPDGSYSANLGTGTAAYTALSTLGGSSGLLLIGGGILAVWLLSSMLGGRK